MANSKKHKRKGLYGTLLFHALLLLSFMFMGLTYTIPPPPEEGITINFGFDDFGGGDIQTEEVVKELQEIEESMEEVNTPDVIETPTQTTEDAPTIKTEEQPKKETPTEKVEEKEEPQPEVNTRALYPGKKTNPSKSEGETIGNGDQGSEDGDPNASIHNRGGIGTNGIAFNLGGRTVVELKKPIYESQAQGTVVVTIRVNRYGKVINATPGAKGSTTTSSYLYARAKEAALQTTFDAKANAPEVQIGIIVYNFRLQ
tara:strand:- start:1326 stop:2096 length:771 start_codon:yes stop_codon:yes gene_type:complete